MSAVTGIELGHPCDKQEYSPLRDTSLGEGDLRRQRMGESLAELERTQTQILERISNLEISCASLLPQPIPIPTHTQNDAVDGGTEARLSAILKANGVNDFSFKRVASDYYDWPLEARRDALSAASVHHLCKSIVLVHQIKSLIPFHFHLHFI